MEPRLKKTIVALTTSSLVLSFLVEVGSTGFGTATPSVLRSSLRGLVYVLVPLLIQLPIGWGYQAVWKRPLANPQRVLWWIWAVFCGLSTYGILTGSRG